MAGSLALKERHGHVKIDTIRLRLDKADKTSAQQSNSQVFTKKGKEFKKIIEKQKGLLKASCLRAQKQREKPRPKKTWFESTIHLKKHQKRGEALLLYDLEIKSQATKKETKSERT